MRLYKEKEAICRELGNPEGLAYSLINQATILSENMCKSNESLPLVEEAYRLATEHGTCCAGTTNKTISRCVK